MTPSRSKTTAVTEVMSVYTAITSSREVAAGPVDEAGTDGTQLAAEHLADEDRVIAGFVLGPGAASEPRQGALDERSALAVAYLDTGPERDRRDSAPCEVLCHPLLFAGEKADREAAGAPDRLVGRGLTPDRDPDERRLE